MTNLKLASYPYINRTGITQLRSRRSIMKEYRDRSQFLRTDGLVEWFVDITYWPPWYNSKEIDMQLRLGTP